MKLYLDLDGVFADCEKGMRDLTGFPYKGNEIDTWKIVDKIPNFFLYLPPTRTAKILYSEVSFLAKCEIIFLTALPIITGSLNTAESDKKQWIKNHLYSDNEVICVSNWSKKKEHCIPGDILVDDSIRNIEDWRSVGGIGVLHNKDKVYDTLYQLVDIGVFGGE